jgi:hypothetical protein
MPVRRLLIAAFVLFPLGAAAATCEEAIARAEAKHQVPPNLLLAIGHREAFLRSEKVVWPWTLNVNGVARFFPTREAAARELRAAVARGVRNVDIGCSQINLYWHGRNRTLPLDQVGELLLDPEINADYAGYHLAQLAKASGSWTGAVMDYHTPNQALAAERRDYMCGVYRRFARLLDVAADAAACGG